MIDVIDVNDKKLEALTDQPVQVTLGGKPYELKRITLGDASAMQAFKRRMALKEDTLEYDVESLSMAFLFCRLMIGNTMGPEEFLNSLPLGETTKLTQVLNDMGLVTPSQK